MNTNYQDSLLLSKNVITYLKNQEYPISIYKVMEDCNCTYQDLELLQKEDLINILIINEKNSRIYLVGLTLRGGSLL